MSSPSASSSSSFPSSPSLLHLAVALDGTGWHPASWREPVARPRELFTAGYWAGLVAEAERGLLDFVTFEDGLAPQSSLSLTPDERTDQVRGRLDAVLTAARIAPLTRHIGLVPTAVVTHTEPFHLSKAIATLDHVSGGRAGLRVRISVRPDEADHFGRRSAPRVDLHRDLAAQPAVTELFDEAADYVEVVRRLWDSWEDDAEIRDVATGRFVDRDKLHYVDFEGRFFRVKGPSITPRPPQGQPLVTALAHRTVPFRLLGRQADLGYVTPHDADQARAIVAEIRAEQEAAGRAGVPVHVFGDLVVFLDETRAAAEDRRARLDDLDGAPYTSDARVFTGTPVELADLLQELQSAGLTGFRLRPAVAGHDLPAVSRLLVPELQRRGAFRRAYEADTLRGLLGLARPANRYATA
ncbi:MULTISPECIES: LLM class flavin-dependent oxidoreductase [Streptomyces]|uniref:Flavin-dependent oxidoreductase, luciferase family (Includes alkanesulfonate monooxygenase SsuD and methylene tetrahydromethanopterin reductase) n=1 Tax=Streptomyces griseoaurantiacus TaxID=68213 RepID=A0A1G7WMU9_9ACTN|nr:LLM class flavin-dependent oxidoreductase [Streptomyces jietaisiensis]SDG72540.1 Flavin-dependent oxidoreductase, luciferase family (includes alkanesulfonate monooxygenase SsuD and methylene tetrahydromethanopterin reductase) [Streptomyces jietaisiensis]